MPKDTNVKKAEIYRMVMPDHTCPYGCVFRTNVTTHSVSS